MKNAVSGVGLAPDAAMVTFPINMFLPGSDINPLKERRREVYDGLTGWKSGFAQAAGSAKMLSVEGVTYEDALTKANNLLLTNLWGDGLPLWPATKERVDWILHGATLPRTHVLGKFPPRGGITTIETCAIALAMAGGRPEYLPVLVAAVDACLDAEGFDQLQATSGGPFPAVIVNGPIAKQIRLNSGFGLLGPDPQRPAGASIGRALRLLQQNVGGALPGVGTMAIFGAMRYTNAVFAEDEDGLPPGWEPHATQRHGYAPGTNSVSIVFASGVTNVLRRGAKKESPEEDALNGMWRMADFMRAPNLSALAGWERYAGYDDARADCCAEDGRARLDPAFDTRVPVGELEDPDGSHASRRCAGLYRDQRQPADAREHRARPLADLPEAGQHRARGRGRRAPDHSYWLQGHSPSVPGRIIRVPETFDRLLADADRDLGSEGVTRYG